MEGTLGIAKSVLKLAGIEITGYDGLIACLIIVAVEYGVKLFFKNADESKWKVVCRLSPIVLGLVTYLVIAIIQKTPIVTGIVHGLGIGLTASGCYASLLTFVKETIKGLKTKGIEEVKAINDKGKKILEENK